MMFLFAALLGLCLHRGSLALEPNASAPAGTCTRFAQRLRVPEDAASNAASPHAAVIADMREQISNGPRTLVIGGVAYPLFYGPRASAGSVTEATRHEEIQVLSQFGTASPQLVAELAVNHSAQLTSLDGFADLYKQIRRRDGKLPRPMASDNSDETFGLQRTTIKSFHLREATSRDLNGSALALSDWQLTQRCGLGAATLELTHAFFVESYPDVGKYNDPQQPQKYVPNVVGFFCVHADSGNLLPIEIRLLDTGLAYTPLDSQDEWTLAKMALEAASTSVHQWQHMAETHAVTIPLRVEVMRTMSEQHPVRALLQHHVYTDFALEMQAAVMLLNESTLMDRTFGWGATGSARFLWDQTQKGISMSHEAFDEDVRRRGLDRIPGHKYALYGGLYHAAMRRFVAHFLDVYYASDEAVMRDGELQHWVRNSQTIPHVRDFPTSFASKVQLCELLTHIVFTATVRHHAMNGAATWHGLSVPFSPAALWKPLPSAKLRPGQTLHVVEYTVPAAVVPAALMLSAIFFRPVPMSESLLGAYTAEPFASEPRLQPAIDAFHTELELIEQTMNAREARCKWPYPSMGPRDLAYYIWV